MVMANDKDWLTSVLPSSHAISSHGKQLELHRRVVHLATLREEALSQLQQLDAVKVSLTERKVIQQGRLMAALDARLAAAHAAVDPHRVVRLNHIKALESAAAHCSRILQGVATHPSDAEWAKLTQQYQQLQQQQEQFLQMESAHLSDMQAASLQPCSVSQVEAVEELRAEKEQLLKDLQQARCGSQQVGQQVHEQRAARLVAEQQMQSMQEELRSLRQLAEHVAMLLHTQQNHQQPSLLHRQQHNLLTALAPAAPVGTAAACSATQSFLAECQQLRQQLQGLSTLATTAAASHAAAAPSDHSLPDHQHQQHLHLELQQLEQDMLDPAAVLAGDPLQELKQPILTGKPGAGGWSGSQPDFDMVGLWRPGVSQESRLRQAYQQMLKQVQARYQKEQRQAENQHHQALQSQAKNHTDALTKLSQQYQESCTRLAAASADASEAQQQVAKLQQENRILQQQIQQLQRELSASAANAVAVSQIQHEQQLLGIKREQEQVVRQAKHDLDSLKQQLQEQAAAMPTAATVATMVATAAAAHLKGQEEAYQSALQDREQQHTSLLQELAQLRQLHAEPSGTSVSSGDETQQNHQQQLQQDTKGDRDVRQAGHSSSLQQQQQQQIAQGSSSAVCDPADTRQHVNRELDQVHVCQASPDSESSLKAWHLGDRISKPAAAGSEAGRWAVHRSFTSDQDLSQEDKEQEQQGASPMSSLIAAVLGSGPTARALQAAHTQRLQQQQQERQAMQQTQHQELQSTSDILRAMDYQGQLAELDHVLGLKQPAPNGTTSAAAGGADGNRPLSSPNRSRPTTTAAVAAGDASERAAVADQIRRQAADEACRKQHGARSNSRSPPLSRRQQQHKGGSVVKNILASSSSSSRQACLRCGAGESSSPGRCCFHPGFVPVPGPLMYSPEWHSCRASCTPDMPGCYSRQEHYYLPHFGVTAGTAKLARQLSSISSGATDSVAAGRRPGSPAAMQASVSAHRLPAHSNHRSSQNVAMESQGDLTPRSIVPRPMTSNTRWH